MKDPKQEPVAWRDVIAVNLVREGINKHRARELAEHFIKLTTPPQRTWVALTPEEVKEISRANRPYVVDMVVALEARLKQKNGYDT